jgi:hypothetical protein
VTWQKQALYGEASKPTWIGHSARHKVHKLVPNDNSQLVIVGIIAEGVIRPYGVPNGSKRLIHNCKRLRIVYVRSGILRGHFGYLPVFDLMLDEFEEVYAPDEDDEGKLVIAVLRQAARPS